MIQNVQTAVNISAPTTLETIESIGTSSIKIREGRQTTVRTISYASVSVNTDNVYIWPYETLSNIEWLFSNLINDGRENYNIWPNYLRIPTAWSYELTITPFVWSNGLKVTTELLMDGNVIYSYKSEDEKDVEHKIKIDAGRFSKITARFTAYRNYSSWISGSYYCSIKITQI